ncbi:MAG: protease inhibitor I42 family protein [Methanothrix sp.]
MVNHEKMLALGMILTVLAIYIGGSLANTNGCNEIISHEETSKSMSDNTLKVMSTSNNESLAQKAINALRSIINEPSDDNAVDDEQIEANDTILAKLNKPFSINLDSNPTTGYSWTVDFDHRFLSGGEENDSMGNTSQPVVVGGGGKQIFTFTPILVGKTTISAVYKRSWEANAAEKRTFSIIIS